MANPVARLTWQVSERNKLAAYMDRALRLRGHAMGALTDPRTASVIWNTPQFTTGSIKWTSTLSSKLLLETGIRPGWIRGEVSNLRAQSSGHVYFSLKDAGAQVCAVLFRGDALRQSVKLRDGLQVIIYGEVSVYEARGQYQVIVRVVVDDGVGRLQREFEALKVRLAAEGLFEAERKKAIPTMPLTVGFITSPSGAAVQDFARIVTRRKWCGRVVVLPARARRPAREPARRSA
jgi:exodeoxyribonuclease VII large subunit